MQQNNKIGRNDKCPCGSGKKYKNCCLNSETVKPPFSQNRQKPDLSFSLEKPPAVRVTPKFPPPWLEKEFKNIKSELLNKKHFDNFWKSYKDLNNIFDTFPSSSVTPEFSTGDLKKIAARWDGDFYMATTQMFEFGILKMFYTNVFKIKSIISSINSAFETGNFTTAAILLRSFLEVVSFLSYFQIKFSKKTEKMRLLVLESEKIKLNTLARGQWAKRLGNLVDEFQKQLEKANYGTSYDWKKKMEKDAGKELNFQNPESNKLNTLTAIQEMSEDTNVDFREIYDFFSEMIHPNFGSHTLVVKTRKQVDELCSEVTIGELDKDIEQARWFFVLFSEGAHETSKVCIKTILGFKAQLDWYARLNDLQLEIFGKKVEERFQQFS